MSNEKPIQPEDVANALLDVVETAAYKGARLTESIALNAMKKSDSFFDRILGVK